MILGFDLSKNYPNEQKIIATTNTSLYDGKSIKFLVGSDGNKYPMPDMLPRPSISFIQKYLNVYNDINCEIIKEVMIECDRFLKPIIRKDGTIIILHMVQDNYTKKEVFDKFNQFLNETIVPDGNPMLIKDKFPKWFEDNF